LKMVGCSPPITIVRENLFGFVPASFYGQCINSPTVRVFNSHIRAFAD